MTAIYTNFAAAASSQNNLMDALGIDWKTLILQIIAFVILVWLLGKFVYPWLIKSVDDRQANIEAVNKAAQDAKAAALQTEAKVEELLAKARVEATDIMATAKLESESVLSEAEEKAKKRSDQIVADAQVEIQKQVVSAKTALYNETVDLVAMATEKIIGSHMSPKLDETIIKDTLKKVK